ncbi:hypothetical protein EX895_003872 [Sporisorium graminicola]|uniref:Alpha/beta hydrolase fold-3 domain-containing protein n=1 Tax=Sporisorium graminicola TaxID=280036 RepID=A0A4U7KRL8_9BASI|nr:hypothetical protein EX895_003872 [Sporisorium graminicola]TKY87195.1 hypothetical protein EX895_003872 [Sporisorium graminicola]
MTITTAGTAVHLAPTVTKTFFKHYYKKAKRSLNVRSRSHNDPSDPTNRAKATDEFMFDEAFHIVKAFINLGTSDTVESLQNFTDAPAPPIPWATTLPVMIPMESCDRAAKIIQDHLGPEDLAKLVGGEKWWQLRPLPGVQGEWIAMSDDWKKMKSMDKRAQQTAAGGQHNPSKPTASAARKQKHKRNKRHERALSEIRAMRQKTESRLKRRSQSFKRTAKGAPSQGDATEADADDAASTTGSSEAEVPQPSFDTAADLDSDSDSQDHASETEELDRLQRVMLYFHGGGYYFGSLATHRYQIVRYARKFGGKCFAPVYRKAPQYPWPCALQDAVASYLYLLYPPKGAKHKPVDPKKLVIAGDSAGGGLTLALLTIIRDMGLPAPAGAVLISPWCDLTHSFPSILQNTATDIIPPYGFIHKPSTLWPINAMKPVKEGKHGSDKTDDEGPRRKVPVGVDEDGEANDDTEPAARKSHDDNNLQSSGSRAGEATKAAKTQNAHKKGVPEPLDLLWSDPITVPHPDPNKEAIELREQIQLYATNDQLTHPLCSAVLSGSLGGLPPLYILAGDAEVLRDEITYLAHRAAHPHRYPLRKDLLDHFSRNRETAEKFDSQPTKVHLQIYDQMCHVLTAFAFTSQSRFAYRAVASFVKHVTGAPTNIKNPFPEAVEGATGGGREEGEEGGEDSDEFEGDDGVSDNVGGEVASPPLASSLQSSSRSTTNMERGKNGSASSTGGLPSTTAIRDEPEPMSAVESSNDGPAAEAAPASSTPNTTPANSTKSRHRSMSKVLSDTLHGNPSGSSSHASSDPSTRHATADVANEYAGQVPLLRPSFQSFMIRERVDVRGYLRPLEPETELQALQVPPDEIGCIKEGPVERYLTGQKQWAKRFAKTARRVEKQRAKNEKTAQKMIEEAHAQGLLDLPELQRKRAALTQQATSPRVTHVGSGSSAKGLGVSAADIARGADKCREKWSWLVDVSPAELIGETPPPAAIAGRRDTDDALVLLRRSLQIRARAYGIQRKSRFWGAEDRTVRAHLRAEEDPQVDTETSTDPTGQTADPQGEAKGAAHHHHHRGLRVWNLLMVRKPASGKEKHSKASTP